MVVEASSEMRDDDVAWLLRRLDLCVVAGLDILEVVVDWPVQVLLVVDCVLVDPAGEADVGVRVDEDAKVDEGWEVLGDLVAHEDVGALQYKQFSRLDVHFNFLPVFLVGDLYLVSDQ